MITGINESKTLTKDISRWYVKDISSSYIMDDSAIVRNEVIEPYDEEKKNYSNKF